MAWTSNVKSLVAEPTQEAWAAFAICLIYEVDPDRAFDILSGENPNDKKYNKYTEQDYEDMIRLKEYCTWGEIGEIFGITPSAANKAVTRYKKCCMNT